MNSTVQILRAQELAQELVDCGHDDIRAADLLDALASIGLRLSTDSTDAAPRAYLDLIKL